MVTGMPPPPEFGDPRLPQRFWSKVKVNPDTGCWEWQRSTFKDGYGQFSTAITTGSGRKNWYAHRYAYVHLVGPVPDGLDLDHQCHNRDPNCAGGQECAHRRCVYPIAHVEPATVQQNLGRSRHTLNSINLAKTCCGICGGPYEFHKDGRRFCRACAHVASAKYGHRKRTAQRAAERAARPPVTHCNNGHDWATNAGTNARGHRVCLQCITDRKYRLRKPDGYIARRQRE